MDITPDRLPPGVTLNWFPLVVRPRPPGQPLKARVAELASLAAKPVEGTHHDKVSRAAEVLNKAALIASDCGVPGLARAMCHRQLELFDRARPLPGWAVKLALQPVLNIPRQLIREGQGQAAYEMLDTLYRAARKRTSADIAGRGIDLRTITSRPEDHRTVCTLIWAALLADGTRALALAGRWQDAAALVATHNGIGGRLLDGRQVTIIALAQQGQANQAAMTMEQSTIAEPLEHAVQKLLHVLCLRAAGADARHHIAPVLAAARALAREQGRSTAVTRTRIGLTALELARSSDHPQSPALRAALIAMAGSDAYCARDILAHHCTRKCLTTNQRQDLQNVVQDSGLGKDTIPERPYRQMMTAVHRAETTLKKALVPGERCPGR